MRSTWPRSAAWSDGNEQNAADAGLSCSIRRRMLADELVGVGQGVEGARVGPEAVELGGAEPAGLQVMAVHVGDFQLATLAGLQGADHLEHVGRIDVDAGDG